MYNKKIFHSCFLDFYQEAPFPHVLGSICCSCPIDAEGGKLSFIFSKKYFNFIIYSNIKHLIFIFFFFTNIIYTRYKRSPPCAKYPPASEQRSPFAAASGICQSVFPRRIRNCTARHLRFCNALPAENPYSRNFAATGRNSQELSKFSCACRQSTRKAKQSSDALWDAAVRLFPRAAFHHADLSVGRGAGHPLSKAKPHKKDLSRIAENVI